MFHTTFALAKEAKACASSYKKMAKALGGVKKYGPDTPLPLSRVLTERGLEDALWALGHVLPEERVARDRLSRLLVASYVEHVAHLSVLVAWDADSFTPRAVARAATWVVGTAAEDKERQWQEAQFRGMLEVGQADE